MLYCSYLRNVSQGIAIDDDDICQLLKRMFAHGIRTYAAIRQCGDVVLIEPFRWARLKAERYDDGVCWQDMF